MGCCASSPHTRRRYRDPADLDEEIVPLRYFGTNRANSNLVPDDIGGLPSAHLSQHLASDDGLLLYDAETDVGAAFRFYRLAFACLFTPWGLGFVAAKGLGLVCKMCPFDEPCCYVRKEYSTRRWFRVYSNRIETNSPHARCPYGYLGCGSWNADDVMTHVFDRGAFGFQKVRCLTIDYLCCIWPVYGETVARQRCQCNGPLWNRMLTDCGGWWCDEWICQSMCCVYRYAGLADADEAAFASSIALQAYFEGRVIKSEDMKECIKYWKENLSEQTDSIERKRQVFCEPHCLPWPNCTLFYKCIHPQRTVPYPDDQVTDELREVYDKYEGDRTRQIENYSAYHGPVGSATTICRALGCRRFFGRKGIIFCTEGCSHCSRKVGDPAPPFEDQDFDDTWDAQTVLMSVLGPPPANVVVRRWKFDPEKGEDTLTMFPEGPHDESELKAA